MLDLKYNSDMDTIYLFYFTYLLLFLLLNEIYVSSFKKVI